MTTYSLFENFTDDKSFNDYPYASVRLHPDNKSIHGKFRANDLVVITYQGRQTLGVLKFEKDISDFNKNSIYLTRDQRRDLALKGSEEYNIPLEIRKGNLLHAIIYFFESLGR
jgi:hypothetical protein